MSFDGFRNEYLTRGLTPNLLKFRQEGVYFNYVETPIFTNYLVTHHTLATGYYVRKHGVWMNTTFESGRIISYGQDLYDYNNSLLPVWTLNEVMGGISGVYMWPGAEFFFGAGKYRRKASYYVKYDSNLTLRLRFETMIRWLNQSQHPNLLMAYFELPDRVAHATNPYSGFVNNTIRSIDDNIKWFEDKLKAIGLFDIVNWIILSDHGVSSVPLKNIINLKQTHQEKCGNFSQAGGNAKFSPFNAASQECFTELIEAYTTINPSSPEAALEYVPERTTNFIRVAKAGTGFLENTLRYITMAKEEFNLPVTNETEFGIHGYYTDNDAIFMGRGPELVKGGHVRESIKIVDYFSLFMFLLQYKGNFSNDGDFLRVVPLLNTTRPTPIPRIPNGPVNWLEKFLIIFICSVVFSLKLYFLGNAFERAIKTGVIVLPINMRSMSKNKNPSKVFKLNNRNRVIP